MYKNKTNLQISNANNLWICAIGTYNLVETFNNVHSTDNIRVKNKIGKSHTKIIVFYWSNHKEGVWGVKPPPEPETKLLVNKKIKKFTNKIWTWGTWTFKVRPLKEHIFFVCVSPYSPVKYFFIFHTTTWMKVNL